MERKRIPRGCCNLRPAPILMLDGAITLKMVTQICYLLDVFITSSYALIFIILETSIWWFMSPLYFIQCVLAVLLLCEHPWFDMTSRVVYKFKIFITVTGLVSMALFYLLQLNLINKKFRGMYFSVHFLIIKIVFDSIQTYFIWSIHVRDNFDMKDEEVRFKV